MKKATFLLILILILKFSQAYSDTIKVKNISRIVGGEEIQVYGYGLVVGLKGTGDTTKNLPTSQSIVEYLRGFGIEVSHTNFQSRNTASVVVSARIPPNLKRGTLFDVNVSSIFDARSLEGGILVNTPLRDNEGNIVAFAQGAIVTPKGSVRTTGIVPNGGVLLSNYTDNVFEDGKVKIAFENVSPSTVNSVVKLIKENFEGVNVYPTDIYTIEVEIPKAFEGNEIEFVSRIMELEVELIDEAIVVIDQKSSSIVITGNPKVYPVSISYKGMKVEFGDFGNFFERGEVYTIPTNNLRDFVDTLSKLGIKSEDLIQILILMKEAGAIKSRFSFK
ncbi:MAG: flagellar basal body P-ring protein FlgI [Spirochaetes bacterium]|nr:flagellar basal body P-ring protein FlgI [Spirochaetota bacterium]